MIRIKSAFALGIHAFPVDIEVDIADGLPQLDQLGLRQTLFRNSQIILDIAKKPDDGEEADGKKAAGKAESSEKGKEKK